MRATALSLTLTSPSDAHMVPDRLRRRWSDRTLAKKKFSCSTFMLYLGIRGKYDNLPHHTIHIARDYAKNLRQIERDFVLPDDPSFYVQNACVTDPSLAPEGTSGLYILVPVPHQKLGHEQGGIQWDAATRQAFRTRTCSNSSRSAWTMSRNALSVSG